MVNLTVEVIATISILLVISSMTKILSKYLKMPFTILLVIVGFLIAFFMKDQPYIIQLASYQGYPDILLYVCLPTLIFEAAFTMDGRLLQKNLIPILVLAIPGLFISTAIIGIIVSILTPLNLLTALLLGSILSATDSIAVIAIFKQIGVPKRLAILVEGESLLNSSTGFVILKTILFIMLSTAFSTEKLILTSIYLFCLNFFGGILIGLITTMIINCFILWMEDEVLIVVSLTVILAYLSFIIAEALFEVSGIMATITAGIVMAYWGKTKFTASTVKYIGNIFDFLAYIVNSLIFILVGFSVNPVVLIQSLPFITIVIIALFIARAVMVFGLMPLLNKISNFIPINMRYKTITWWSGIQGAIGLTMVLSIGNKIPEQQLLLSIVMGVVLFTIIVQGSLMPKLIHWLKLDKIALYDRFATTEAEIIAEKVTLDHIQKLQQGGLFSMKVAKELSSICEKTIKIKKNELHNLKGEKISDKKLKKLVFLLCLAKEKHLFYEMFTDGNLTEQTYRLLNHMIAMEIDLMRFRDKNISFNLSFKAQKNPLGSLLSFIERSPIFSNLANQLKIRNSILDYEKNWGLHQGCITVLNYLNTINETELIANHIIQEVRAVYLHWLNTKQKYLNEVADQFPEFVKDIQNRFVKRILLHAKYDSIMNQLQQGLLPSSIANQIAKNYLLEIRQLSKHKPEKLKLDPYSLLSQVPFLKNIPSSELKAIINILKEHHAQPQEIIIRQDEPGDALYLITRGVIRILKNINEENIEVATLMAGDFFGELALLYPIKRTATCIAVTPCILYVLTRNDFEILLQHFPTIKKIIYEESERRKD